MPKQCKCRLLKDGIFVLSLWGMKKAPIYIFTALFFLCVFFTKGQPPVADAGAYRKLCPNYGSTLLGGSPTGSGGVGTLNYQWQPTTPLSNSQIPNPATTVTVTTTFTVTVTGSNGETAKDTITVYVYNYSVDAGKDTTIKAGHTITLHGTAAGATGTYWQPPTGNIFNQNTLTPDVFPSNTVLYTLACTFPGGCTLYDTVRVTVIASSDLVFFNTFTPNGDGANDYFIIGNLDKYPDNVLEIYNRYGQKVFTKVSYQNDWNGTYLNSELPGGTYFFVLDTKTETGGKKHGQITIIR